MKNNFKASAFVSAFIVSLGAALLSSCGETNNLPDPSLNTSVTKCRDLVNATCISGRFIADAVGGIDYQCGGVAALTKEDGAFVCPVGSDVTFSLTNPKDRSGKKIILGKVKVLPGSALGEGLAARNPENTGTPYAYFYITPNMLSTSSVVVNNIVRLLQAWGSAAPLSSPARAIFIPPTDKEFLKNLADTIDATDSTSVFTKGPTISSDLFADAVEPFLLGASKTLLDYNDAEKLRLADKAYNSTVAGAYSNPGALLAALPLDSGQFYGMFGNTGTNYLVGGTWTAVDRKGRMFGFGVYSTGASALPVECRSLRPVPANCATPQPVYTLKMKTGVSPWPVLRSDRGWSVSYDLLDAGGVNPVAGAPLLMGGSLDRGAIAGSDQIYKNIYGEAPSAPNTFLGNLTGTSQNFSYINAHFTLTGTRLVAPTLDPVFATLSFPLNLLATFNDASCHSPATSPVDCPVSTLHISILEDGNIVSNLPNGIGNYTCGASFTNNSPAMTNLVDSNGTQQYPLGMVAQVFTTDGGTKTYLSPILMIPVHAKFGVLGGFQVGVDVTSASTSSTQVRIRANASAPTSYLRTYQDSALTGDAPNFSSTDVDNTAAWGSQKRFYTVTTDPKFESGVFSTVPDPACP